MIPRLFLPTLTVVLGLAAAARISGPEAAPAPIAAPAADHTAVIQAALDAGGTVRLGPGVHRVGPLRMPPWPATVQLVGDGIGRTILEPLRPGDGILARVAYRVRSCRVADLTVRAHPAGGGAAIDLAGHSACDLERVEVAGRWDAGVVLDATGKGCYGNVLRRLGCEGTPSPRVLVGSRNSGSVASNANANRIEAVWCYWTRGMDAVLDLGDTTATVVSGGVIESAHGAVAVVPGNATTLDGLWIESVGEVVRCRPAGSSITPNWLTVRDVYISPKRPILMPPHARGWRVEGSPATAEIAPLRNDSDAALDANTPD